MLEIFSGANVIRAERDYFKRTLRKRCSLFTTKAKLKLNRRFWFPSTSIYSRFAFLAPHDKKYTQGNSAKLMDYLLNKPWKTQARLTVSIKKSYYHFFIFKLCASRVVLKQPILMPKSCIFWLCNIKGWNPTRFYFGVNATEPHGTDFQVYKQRIKLLGSALTALCFLNLPALIACDLSTYDLCFLRSLPLRHL